MPGICNMHGQGFAAIATRPTNGRASFSVAWVLWGSACGYLRRYPPLPPESKGYYAWLDALCDRTLYAMLSTMMSKIASSAIINRCHRDFMRLDIVDAGIAHGG